MGDTALSGVVGVGVWVTLITPKVNTYIVVTHNKHVHTVTSAEVRRGKAPPHPTACPNTLKKQQPADTSDARGY